MSDQSESLGSVWRVFQTALQFYFQYKMNKRLSGKPSKIQQAKMKQAIQNLYKARSKVAQEMFAAKPFQFTGTDCDMYYFLANDRLSTTFIKNMPDEKLQSKIIDQLYKFEKRGFIKYNNAFDDYSVTDEGLKFVCNKENAKVYEETVQAYNSTIEENLQATEQTAAQATEQTAAQATAQTAAQATEQTAAQATAQTAAQATAQIAAQATAGVATGGASLAAGAVAQTLKMTMPK